MHVDIRSTITEDQYKYGKPLCIKTTQADEASNMADLLSIYM